MKIIVKTILKGNIDQLFPAFNKDLFKEFEKSLIPIKTIRYDGEQIGHRFEIHIGPAGFRQKWIGEITGRHEIGQKRFFIDKGIELPTPLTAWEHHHIMEQIGPDQVELRDEVTFSAGLMTAIIYPAIYSMFLMRRPQYLKYFKGFAT